MGKEHFAPACSESAIPPKKAAFLPSHLSNMWTQAKPQSQLRLWRWWGILRRTGRSLARFHCFAFGVSSSKGASSSGASSQKDAGVRPPLCRGSSSGEAPSPEETSKLLPGCTAIGRHVWADPRPACASASSFSRPNSDTFPQPAAARGRLRTSILGVDRAYTPYLTFQYHVTSAPTNAIKRATLILFAFGVSLPSRNICSSVPTFQHFGSHSN